MTDQSICPLCNTDTYMAIQPITATGVEILELKVYWCGLCNISWPTEESFDAFVAKLEKEKS